MRVITQPTSEPITINDVKAQIGIQMTDVAQDSLIERRITEARQWAEDYMQRALITQTQEIRLNNFSHSGDVYENAIQLPFPNLLTVVSIKYIDLNGTEQTIASTDYVVDTYAPVGFVMPAYGVSWPYPRLQPNAVRIQYTCGYGATSASVPALLREALILLVGHWMNNQPQSENGVMLARVPFAVRDIFDKFSMVKYI